MNQKNLTRPRRNSARRIAVAALTLCLGMLTIKAQVEATNLGQIFDTNARQKTAPQVLLNGSALGGISPLQDKKDEISKHLKDLKHQPRVIQRAQAAKALGEMGPAAKEAVPALLEALKDRHWVRCEAAKALGKIGEPAEAIVPALIQTLRDRNEHVRIDAAQALGFMGPSAKEATPELIKSFKDKNSWVHYAAAKALISIGPEAVEQAVGALIETHKNADVKDWRARYHAASTLGQFGPAAKDAVPILIQTLKDGLGKDPYISVAVVTARTLGEIGPAAKEAIPVLTELLNDPEPNMRAIAREAIEKITQAGKEGE